MSNPPEGEEKSRSDFQGAAGSFAICHGRDTFVVFVDVFKYDSLSISDFYLGKTCMNINGKNLILQKLIFEVRYDFGYAYLDKCGRIINAITREFPEWRVNSIDLGKANLANLLTNCSLAFSSQKLDFSLEQQPGGESLSLSNLDELAIQADIITNILIEQLGLKEFTRMGFRSFHWYPCKSKGEALAWIKNLHLYSVSETLGKAFGAQSEAESLIVIIPGEERKYRIELSVIERAIQLDMGQDVLKISAKSLHQNQKQHLLKQLIAQKKIQENPDFAASIDLDVFQEFPLIVAPGDFIQTSYAESTKRLIAAVEGGKRS